MRVHAYQRLKLLPSCVPHLLGVAAATKDSIAKAVLRGRTSVREVLQEALGAPVEGGAPLAPPAALTLDQGRIRLRCRAADAKQRCQYQNCPHHLHRVLLCSA